MSVTMFTMPLHCIYLDVVTFRFVIGRDDQATKTRYCLFTFATHEHEDRLSGRKLNRDVYGQCQARTLMIKRSIPSLGSPSRK